jgi:hypothetical protein
MSHPLSGQPGGHTIPVIRPRRERSRALIGRRAPSRAGTLRRSPAVNHSCSANSGAISFPSHSFGLFYFGAPHQFLFRRPMRGQYWHVVLPPLSSRFPGPGIANFSAFLGAGPRKRTVTLHGSWPSEFSRHEIAETAKTTDHGVGTQSPLSLEQTDNSLFRILALISFGHH